MPFPRVMGDAILTLDGNVLIVNGAQTGVAGCVPLLPRRPSPSLSSLPFSSLSLSPLPLLLPPILPCPSLPRSTLSSSCSLLPLTPLVEPLSRPQVRQRQGRGRRLERPLARQGAPPVRPGRHQGQAFHARLPQRRHRAPVPLDGDAHPRRPHLHLWLEPERRRQHQDVPDPVQRRDAISCVPLSLPPRAPRARGSSAFLESFPRRELSPLELSC